MTQRGKDAKNFKSRLRSRARARTGWTRAAVVIWLAFLASSSRGEGILVAVAANALPVMEELGREFAREAGVGVTFSAGATGLLARQLREGAPFDVFVSADMKTVEALAREGLVTSGSVAEYARGKLVLWQGGGGARGSGVRVGRVEDLTTAGLGRARIAIANPETAPYGAAAVEAMGRAGVINAVRERLVYGENVGQAFQFARSGNAEVAFLPLSLVMGESEKGTPVPEQLYSPIVQGLGVVAASKRRADAERFRGFVLGPRGGEVFGKFGYGVR